MKKFSVLFFLFFVFSVTVGSCQPKPPVKSESAKTVATPGESSVNRQKPISFRTDAESTSLLFTLSESASQHHVAPVPVSEGTPLSQSTVSALLKRTKGAPKSAAEKKAFALRAASLPAPKTGERINTTLGAPAKTPPVITGDRNPLEVISHAPEGKVELVPYVTITFSKPMVSVTGIQDTEKVPVTLSPQPKGRWRWLGTRTLQFKPENRMPMATAYTVTIPKNTRSADGSALKEAVSFSFETPPVKLVARYPEGGPRELDQTILLVLNQQVNPESLLPFIEVSTRGRSLEYRMATPEEIDELNKSLPGFQKDSYKRRIYLRVTGLPKASTIEVLLKKGAPSAEGPLTPKVGHNFGFFTYYPMQFNGAECGYDGNCPPNHPFALTFNNAIDKESFKDNMITVTPVIPGMEISRGGSSLYINGLKKGNTTYTVKISESLTDVFGQQLQKAGTAKLLTTRMQPTLVGPPGELVTLSPFDQPAVAVHSMNHQKLKVTVHRMTPSLLREWAQWKYDRHDENKAKQPMPGKRVMLRTLKLPKNDDWQHSVIDLSPYLKQKAGHFVVQVEPVPQSKEPWRRQEVLLWVQVTQIGVSVFRENEHLLAWATALKDGSPMKDVRFTIWPGENASAMTDASGLAQIALPNEGGTFIVAEKGSDTAIMYPSSLSSLVWGGGHWSRVLTSNRLSCYAVSDRDMYKPGEKVNIKGWLREIDVEKAGTIAETIRPVKKVRWQLNGPRRNPLGKGEVNTTALGGFHIEISLPKNANLGTAELELISDRGDLDFPYTHKYHRIQIQEFKKPEFEVSAAVSEGPHVLGETAEASITAKYYTGEPLLGAPVQWRVSTSQGSYTPPSHSEFTFGTYRPIWWFRGMPDQSGTTELFEGKTGAGGAHKLDVHFEALMSKEPTNVHFTGTVTDVNRQQWTANTSLLVHPSARYVGLKADKNFVRKGDSVNLDVVVTDIDGVRTRDEAVTVNFLRLDYQWKNGHSKLEEVPAGSCSFQSIGAVHGCTFTPKAAGSYKWVAAATDREGRPTETTMWLWVTGDDLPQSESLGQDEVRIIPQQESFAPGHTANLLIQAPFYPAEGLVTARKGGIRFKKRITFDGPQAEVAVPISKLDIPKVTVKVDINGVKQEDDQRKPGHEKKTPAFASGQISLTVSPYQKRLNVAVKPESEALAPAAKAKIAVTVKDVNGVPQKNAEVALWVVDEAVLALSNYTLPDPVELFYAPMEDGVTDTHSRSTILLQELPLEWVGEAMENMAVQSAAPLGGWADGDADYAMPAAAMKMARPAPNMAERSRVMKKSSGGGGAQAQPAILVRSNFDSLAYYAATLKTNGNGVAHVAFDMPHSLTRYRVLAVAADDANRFGNGESAMTVRLPLMVRPAAPRFLNFGDRFEFPVVVQNQTNTAQTVQVALRAENLVFGESVDALRVGEAAGRDWIGKEIVVPPANRVEVRFPAGTVQAGTAQVQVVASSKTASDSALAAMPVWTPATTEAFATYGAIEKGNVIQPVKAPKDVWRQYGGVEITTSSTGLQALTDAFLYLVTYRYECSEQLASRILSIATLKDVLFAFNAKEMPDTATLNGSVKTALKKLKGRQDWSGEFGLWYRGGRSWPYANVHVANALAVAKQKGFGVDEDMYQRTINYLTRIDSHIPGWYSEDSKNALRAYALYVLSKMGRTDEQKALALIQRVGLDQLSFESKGWLLHVIEKDAEMKQQLLRDAANHVSQTAKDAHFVTQYSDGAYVLMHSDRRVDGIWLEALLEKDKENALIPKLMSGLLAHRKQGRWASTQENAFVLIALDKYFHVYERVTPDFVARVWLGDRVSEGHEFKGRTTETVRVNIPMNEVSGNKENVIIEKDGAGRMYYRIGMSYAPKSLSLDAADEGFVVQRIYRGVDNDEDVWQDNAGVWHVRAGARVHVEMTMVAPSRRYHVALEDRLPAGLEPVNPALAVEQNVSDVGADNNRTYWWWYRPWFEHQNLRDERVEAFASLLWDGVYTYSYEAKATTPGTFVVPPAKAMEMYTPETFGRSATDKMVVE